MRIEREQDGDHRRWSVETHKSIDAAIAGLIGLGIFGLMSVLGLPDPLRTLSHLLELVR